MNPESVPEEVERWHAVEEGAYLVGDTATMNIASGRLDEIVTDEALAEMKGEQ